MTMRVTYDVLRTYKDFQGGQIEEAVLDFDMLKTLSTTSEIVRSFIKHCKGTTKESMVVDKDTHTKVILHGNEIQDTVSKDTTLEWTTEIPAEKLEGFEDTIKLSNPQSSTWDMENSGEQDIVSTSKKNDT